MSALESAFVKGRFTQAKQRLSPINIEKDPSETTQLSNVNMVEEDRLLSSGLVSGEHRLKPNQAFQPKTQHAPEHPYEEDDDEGPRGCKAICSFPPSIWFIFVNEVCERFSYYGMRTILIIYFTSILGWNDNLAITIYHTFTMLCYFTPIVGSIIADSLLGKYLTILIFSIVYAFGHVIKSFSAFSNWFNHTEMVVGTLIGLVLIALGTGGIKPCVSAFGGDQIPPQKVRLRESFFSVFYITINIGSLTSMIVTPILREIPCMGNDTCYPLAFGTPAILFVIAIIVFVLGTPMYKRPKMTGESVLLKGFGAVKLATQNRIKYGKSDKRFLYHADTKYDRNFLDELRQLGKMLVLLLPVGIFWMGYDQQGSTWTLQATKMNGKLGFFTIYPDQVQFINPVLIIILVPFTVVCVYPVLNKLHILTSHLQRMCFGMLLAGAAFVIAGFIEMKNVNEMPYTTLLDDESSLWVINSSPCDMNVEFTLNGKFMSEVEVLQKDMHRFAFDSGDIISVHAVYNDTCAFSSADVTQNSFDFTQKDSHSMNATYLVLYHESNQLTAQSMNDAKESPPGSADCYITYFVSHPADVEIGADIYDISGPMFIPNLEISDGKKLVEVSSDVGNASSEVDLQYGGVYLITVTTSESQSDGPVVDFYKVLQYNRLSIAWQAPQYVVVTFAEVFVSVTGLDFAYSEVGPDVKSIAQAIWLLTDAIGNFFDIVLFSTLMAKMSTVWQFFVVAIIMGVGAFIFMLLSVWYTPKTIRKNYHELMESNLTGVSASVGGDGLKLADSRSLPYGATANNQSKF